MGLLTNKEIVHFFQQDRHTGVLLEANVVSPGHCHKTRIRDRGSHFTGKPDWVGNVISKMKDKRGGLYLREKMPNIEMVD
jgi:hypothetical protein